MTPRCIHAFPRCIKTLYKKYEVIADNDKLAGSYLLYASCINSQKEMVSNSVCFGEVTIEKINASESPIPSR